VVGRSSQWRYTHNYRHHVVTNVVGMDGDLGYGVMRVTRDEKWKVRNLTQPLRNMLMAITFEWGIGLHDLHSERQRASPVTGKAAILKAFARKTARQVGKDYVVLPLLSRRRWRRTLKANVIPNLLRNVWAYVVICCGHFAHGAEKFTEAALEDETKPEWYLRQMLGAANFDARPVMAFMSGNLCYQIEHHIFPDLPSNRYAEVSHRLKDVCATYDLPYTTGPLSRQYLPSLRTILKLALPDRFLTATSDDAPETSSEDKFIQHEGGPEMVRVPNARTRRDGPVGKVPWGHEKSRRPTGRGSRGNLLHRTTFRQSVTRRSAGRRAAVG
jgi:fatty acid desaturase